MNWQLVVDVNDAIKICEKSWMIIVPEVYVIIEMICDARESDLTYLYLIFFRIY